MTDDDEQRRRRFPLRITREVDGETTHVLEVDVEGVLDGLAAIGRAIFAKAKISAAESKRKKFLRRRRRRKERQRMAREERTADDEQRSRD